MCCFVCRVSRKVDLLRGGCGGRCLEHKEKNCTPLWEKAHLQGKMGGKKKTSGPKYCLLFSCRKKCTQRWRKIYLQIKIYKRPQVRSFFFLFSCRKNADNCNEKNFYKTKSLKYCMFGPLFGVQIPKNCAPL